MTLQDPSIQTEVIGHDDVDCGIVLYDENGSKHTVQVTWDGDIAFHGNDDYPHKREERTLEEQKIMTQVENRAKYAAQQEFPEENILNPEFNPAEIERAIVALQTMHVDDFAEQFQTFYEMLTSPESFGEVTKESARFIFQPFFIDEQNTVVSVPRPIIQYKQNGESKTTEADLNLLENNPGTKFSVDLPPLTFDDGDYEFPDGFQVFLIENLGAQVRDAYRHMGEDAPEEYAYDLEFPGILVTAADNEFYDDW
jgi:hypothetical protein